MRLILIINRLLMQDSSENKDFIGDYDLSRTDKRFCIKIPRYSMEDGVVLYEIVLKDLVNNEVFLCSYRFKELKAINDELIDLKFVLPPFPKTHFWTKTNKSPELIEQRRARLENYLDQIINDPYLRGQPEIKKIVKMFRQTKQQNKSRLTTLITKNTQSQQQTKSCCSLSKSDTKQAPLDQWIKKRRNRTLQNQNKS